MPVHPALLSCLACAILPVALAAAQFRGPVPGGKEPPPRKTMRETRVPVTVQGCLRRGSLQLSQWPFKDDLAYIFETDVVVLDGPKDVLNQLRQEHNLHEDEVTGIAIVQASPDGSTTTNIETKEIGGGTLTSGVREASGAQSNLAQSVKLRVTSFRHLDDRCAISRTPKPER
jgi:hypothetical protein